MNILRIKLISKIFFLREKSQVRLNKYIVTHYIMDYPLGNKRGQTTNTSSNMYKFSKNVTMSNSQAPKYTYFMIPLI